MCAAYSSGPAGGAIFDPPAVVRVRIDSAGFTAGGKTMLTPLAGDDPRVAGRFRLQGRLGVGGMGTVYLGFSDQGEVAAVRYPHSDLAVQPGFQDRFRREIAAARRVHGRCVAEVVDADAQASRPWLATSYVEGESLASVVAQRGRLDDRLLRSFAAGLADALVAIHAAEVTHGDLRPPNVLLASDGPKIVDFGLAHGEEAMGTSSHDDLMAGLGWMAPEQLAGHAAGWEADVFAWGCCVTFAASGRHPFAPTLVGGPVGGTEMDPPAVAMRIMRADPDLSGVPEPLATLARSALAKDPRRRPTARDLVSGLVGRAVTSRTDADDAVTRLLATRWRLADGAAERGPAVTLPERERPPDAAVPAAVPATGGRSRRGWRVATGVVLVAAGLALIILGLLGGL
jgi:serine/threonine protein kinase